MKNRTLLAMLCVFCCTAAFAKSIDIPDLELTDVGSDGIPKGWQLDRFEPANGTCKVENGALRITKKDKSSLLIIKKTIPISKLGRYVFSIEVSLPEGGFIQCRDPLLLHGVVGKPNKKTGLRTFQTCERPGDFSKVKNGVFTKVSAVIDIKSSKVKSIIISLGTPRGEAGDFLVKNADFSVYPLGSEIPENKVWRKSRSHK